MERETCEALVRDTPELAHEVELWQALGSLGDARHHAEQSDEELLTAVLGTLRAHEASGDEGEEDGMLVQQDLDERPRETRATSKFWVSGVLLSAASLAFILQAWGPSRSAWHGEDTVSAVSSAPMLLTEQSSTGQVLVRQPPVPMAEPVSETLVRERPERASITQERPQKKRAQSKQAPNRPVSSALRGADQVLAEAQEFVVQGRSNDAIAAYEQLIRTHPHSDEAHAALISLGRMELGLGHALQGLRHFRRYLASGGSMALAEEASYGEIRALQRLGEQEQEHAAIRAFQEKYSRSMHLPGMKRRALALSRTESEPETETER